MQVEKQSIANKRQARLMLLLLLLLLLISYVYQPQTGRQIVLVPAVLCLTVLLALHSFF